MPSIVAGSGKDYDVLNLPHFFHMQKHFAVVTGIAMLAVAGVVVSQQGGIFPGSMRGQMLPPGSTGTYGGMPMSTGMMVCPTGTTNCDNMVCCSAGQICDGGTCWIASSSPSSACANPANCFEGYVGDCDPITCLETYNTGSCQTGTSLCYIYETVCEDMSLCEGFMSSMSSLPASIASCGGFGEPPCECVPGTLTCGPGTSFCDDTYQNCCCQDSPTTGTSACPDDTYQCGGIACCPFYQSCDSTTGTCYTPPPPPTGPPSFSGCASCPTMCSGMPGEGPCCDPNTNSCS